MPGGNIAIKYLNRYREQYTESTILFISLNSTQDEANSETPVRRLLSISIFVKNSANVDFLNVVSIQHLIKKDITQCFYPYYFLSHFLLKKEVV